MNEKELKTKLKSLDHDLQYSKRGINERMALIRSSEEDKQRILMDLFAKENAPLKITRYDGLRGGKSEEDRMIDFSLGFQAFYRNMEKETRRLIKMHEEANSLLRSVLSLENPYQRIIYRRYIDHRLHDSIAAELYMARATYYRNYNKALVMLTDICNSESK